MGTFSKKQTGFTIVELLIVIVVIGILATITIVAYNGISTKAKVTRANTELAYLQKAIIAARVNTDKTLLQITGSGCTCAMSTNGMNNTLDKISAASGMNLNGLKAGDPWGNLYWIDENEGEVAGACTMDTIQISPTQGIAVIRIPTYAC